MPAPDGAGMKKTLTVLTAIAAMTVVFVEAPATSSPTEPDSKALAHAHHHEEFVLLGSPTEEEVDLAMWARTRYELAGLPLPSVAVEFPAHADTCGGNTGVAVHGGRKPRIVLCTSGVPETAVKKALLHELAHVWAHASLEPDIRQAFMRQRGLDAWANGPWVERGSEHAAEIIAWGLMDRELVMLTLPDHDPANLATGYRLLTGYAPPTR